MCQQGVAAALSIHFFFFFLTDLAVSIGGSCQSDRLTGPRQYCLKLFDRLITSPVVRDSFGSRPNAEKHADKKVQEKLARESGHF